MLKKVVACRKLVICIVDYLGAQGSAGKQQLVPGLEEWGASGFGLRQVAG